jgi:hypothetical protein
MGISNLIVTIGTKVDGSQHSIGWRWHGAAGVVVPWLARPDLTEALRYMAMVLRFFVVFLPMEPAGCEELTMGVFNWRGAPD